MNKNKIFSSVISLLLVFSVLISLVIPVSAQSDELKIMVATDTHFRNIDSYGGPDESMKTSPLIRGNVDPEIFYYASQQGQMDCESKAIMKQMLKTFIESDDEFLIIGGDLTDGSRAAHTELAALFKETEEKSGKHIFVTCGNHDCAAKADDNKIDISEFTEIYADFGFNEAISRDENSASYAVDLSDSYRLLAIDSCIYGKDDGEITNNDLKWIEEQVNAAKKDGKKLIAMMHHSILPHFTVQPIMNNYGKVAEKFADWGIKYVFTGHIHANDIASAVSKKGNTVYDVQTGSLITAPNAFRHVSFTSEKVEITSEAVTEIDINDLPDGYSQAQLDYIQQDFTAYTQGFFEAGMCRWLNRYIGSAAKVGKTLKLKEGSAAYNALDSLMLNIGDALVLPIYDDGSTPDEIDSLEEVAALSGGVIPESDYQMMYQVVSVVYGGFYHGDEPESFMENEVPLLLACLKAGLAYAVSGMVFSGKGLGGLNELVAKVTGKSPRLLLTGVFTDVNYSKNVATLLVDSLLSPLVEGLSCDMSAPADVNVTLEPYGEQVQPVTTVPIGFLNKLIAFLTKFFNAFSKNLGLK